LNRDVRPILVSGVSPSDPPTVSGIYTIVHLRDGFSRTRTWTKRRAKLRHDSGGILVVDDDAGSRTLMSGLLQSARFPTTTAATGEEALTLARRERPALVLLDVALPGLSGYEVCRQLKEEYGQELMIALVSGERRETFDRVAGLLIGADDYITKPYAPDELIARVRRLVARNSSIPAAPAPNPTRLDLDLTRRELQVLRLLASGLDQRKIASELSISSKTVSTHIQNLLGKLGVHSRAQAIVEAYRVGLMSFEPVDAAAESA
jgi:two-component system, NarL family, nitrate/nitrite response regulator NarL